MRIRQKFVTFILVFTIVACSVFVTYTLNREVTAEKNESNTSLHFINVNSNLEGENDCTALSVLIQHNGKNILIDTGIEYASSQKKVVSYLQEQGVKTIDYLIITHFHNDHVGGVSAVVNNFDIDKVYYKTMSDWSMSSATVNRRQFDNVYLDIYYKVNSDNTYPTTYEPNEEGYRITLDSNTYFEFYNCTELYDELLYGRDYNEYSMQIKFVNGNASTFIGGDADNTSDKFVLGKIGHVDVFGLQHHGCDLPYNSQDLFEELTPTYSVATCYRWDETVPGFNNLIYLPGKDLLERAESVDSQVILTGELGDIVFDSDQNHFALRNDI